MPTSKQPRAACARRWFRALPLADKWLLRAAVLILVLGTVASFLLHGVVRGKLDEQVMASTRVLAASAALGAGDLLASGDERGLLSLARELQHLDPDISYVAVFDRDGRVLAHTFPWDPPDAVVRRGGRLPATGDAPRVRVGRESFYEGAAPIRSGNDGVGFVHVGVSTARVDRAAANVGWSFLFALGCLSAVGLVAARHVIRKLAGSVSALTRLADEVSIGNLEVTFPAEAPVRCWELKSCGKTDCAAHGNTEVPCWFVDGTPCEGYEPRFPQKLLGCRACEVYQAHRGDELVQLADSFRHMTLALRRSRADLEGANQFRQSLIHNCFDGIIGTDDTGTIRIFNRVAQNVTGLRGEEVIGRARWGDLFAAGSSEALLRPLFQDGSRVMFGFYRKEIELRAASGGCVRVRASAITLRDGDHHVGKVLFFQDMREIMELREELLRSERLAATGQAVAALSHSLKNILEGLRGGAYVYKRGIRLEDPSVRKEAWEMVERNIERISALVADLLNFSHPREPNLRMHDPNELVTDVVATLKPKAEACGRALTCSLDPGAVSWPLDDHAMHQCLTNLVSNALDAVEGVEGGRVEVSTTVCEREMLRFRVADNGPGVALALVDRLFSSMLSTKGSKGTGLGLLVAHKIAAEHGGTVQLDRSSPSGAAFDVRLPWRELEAKALPGPGEST